MLEMMPGSLLDKTNNNLNNFVCIHSDIPEKIEPENENVINKMQSTDLSLTMEIKNTVDDKNSNNNVTEMNSNLSANVYSTNKIKSSDKILKFLKKHNVSENDLIKKFKNIKRHAKDKRKPNRVVSIKLKRHSFKSSKFKWSRRRRNTKTKTDKSNLKHNNKPELSLRNNEENTNQDSQIETEENTEEDPKTETNKTETENDRVSNFKTDDDDIRNKIKEQLELLRKNRRPIIKCNESENKVAKANEKTEKLEETSAEKEKKKIVPANLSDVLLSNEGELSIVSVVGGYVSDDESHGEKDVIIDKEEETYTEKTNKYAFNRGTSITDILLQREFSCNPNDTSSNESHLIKPKKTNDITKIKGWRSKHFVSPVKNTDNDKFEDEKKSDEELLKSVNEVDDLKLDNLENPIPSTSSSILSQENNAIVEVKSENILKQGENLNTTSNKSAFVSDMLDTFLTNHAELKISYEVPKLSAEEAITKPESVMPVTSDDYLSVVNKNEYRPKYQKKNSFKPKTLAEKRRMLELDRKNQLLHDMETNESMYLKRLEYCEKRNKNETAKDIRENLVAGQIPFSKHCWNMATKCYENAQQFAVVNGKKIRIAGSLGGNDLIINLTQSKYLSNKENNFKQQKSSIKRPLCYRPGPLSKKRKLFRDSRMLDNWECHVLKMPKIKLVLFPEEGKQMPPIAEKYLQLCRNEQGHISSEWAQFAVSVVRSKDKEHSKTKVEFDLPYANGQNKLLVRKLVKQMYSAPIKQRLIIDKFPDSNVDNSIKDIMSDMLKCIENQQLDKSIIKEDPDLKCFSKNKNDTTVDRPPSPINPMVQAIIKRPNAKRSKTTLELRRLNVQVIEVDVKEEENVSENCNKDYCRLGCVCKSLRGATSLVPEHCGREECLLECSCSFNTLQKNHHSITLPAGTDLLSSTTMVRLQDEAKRNLAKVEREFTQTVIKANNQTIMVGGGARDRQRRVPKVPKKYSNYVQKAKGLSYDKMISTGLLEEDTDDPEFVPSGYTTQRSKQTKVEPELEKRIVVPEVKKPVPIWNKKVPVKKPKKLEKVCQVTLERLKLKNVVSWCMVHNLYKCHCNGKANFENEKPKIEGEILCKEVFVEGMEDINEYIAYAPRFTNRYQPENNSAMTITDVTEKYCARTRALSTNYYQARNKSQTFKARYKKIKEEQEKCPVDFDSYIQKENTDIKPIIIIQETVTKPKTIIDIDNSIKTIKGEIQELLNAKKITLVDMNAILNPPKSAETENSDKKSNTQNVVSAASFIDYDRSYFGILTPSREWLKKFYKMLNLNMANIIVHQIRLLEWETLVRRQKNGMLQLWFNNKKYNNIILTEDRKRPSRAHMNIKLFECTNLDKFRLPDIITSLFSNKLPGVAKNANETYVILVYNGLNWEARGTIVLNETGEMCKRRLGQKKTPLCLLDRVLKPVEKVREFTIFSPQNSNEGGGQTLYIKPTSAITVEVVDNNSNAANTVFSPKPIENALEITKIPLPNEHNNNSTPQYQQEQQIISSRNSKNIIAPLPTGNDKSRWFMLILENDFSVIRISFSDFHIKYTHLTTAIRMACKNNKTVRIRSQEKNTPEKPGYFGIYAVPRYRDRIFFGPYNDHEDHGLETFRYVNGKLVNTKIYNKMRGSTERKTTGVWFTQSSMFKNNVNLEPQLEDNYSSSSECSTEVTTVDNRIKPQIEFVDLTENDSDNENGSQKSHQIDPLFSVLSADFTKKIKGDITIEPVFETKNDKVSVTIDEKQCDISIQPINFVDIPPAQISRKRKSLPPDTSQEPAKKHQPMVIDTIDLDRDASKNKRRLSNKSKQMPGLCPIKNAKTVNLELYKKTTTYVITNIPGIGYFEVILRKNKYFISMNVNGQLPSFVDVASAIDWLKSIFKGNILFVPPSISLNFSTLDTQEAPDMPKFDEQCLSGTHMLCEKGVFDLLRLSIKDVLKIRFSKMDTRIILSRKCAFLMKRLDNCGENALHDAEETSLPSLQKQCRPRKLSNIENQLRKLINFLLKDVTHGARVATKKYIREHTGNHLSVVEISSIIFQKVNSVIETHPAIIFQKVNSVIETHPAKRERTILPATTVELPSNSLPVTVQLPVAADRNALLPNTADKNAFILATVDKNLLLPTTADKNAVPTTADKNELLSTTADKNALLPTAADKNALPSTSLPAGKLCKIINGKLHVIDKVPSTSAKNSEVTITKQPIIVTNALNATNISNTASNSKPYPVNLLSAATMQNLIHGVKSTATKTLVKPFEMVVPITGLQSPAMVIGVAQKPLYASLLLPKPSAPKLLLPKPPNNTQILLLPESNHSPKVVDLTDD